MASAPNDIWGMQAAKILAEGYYQTGLHSERHLHLDRQGVGHTEHGRTDFWCPILVIDSLTGGASRLVGHRKTRQEFFSKKIPHSWQALILRL